MDSLDELVCPPTPGSREQEAEQDSLMLSSDDDEVPCGQRPPPASQVRHPNRRKNLQHIRLKPSTHRTVQRAKIEVARLAGLRNRAKRQASKLERSLARGEFPDWLRVRKNIPSLPLGIPCPPEMIVSWNRKLAECTVGLGI